MGNVGRTGGAPRMKAKPASSPKRGTPLGTATVAGGRSISQAPIADVLDAAEARWREKMATSDPGGRETARTTLTLLGTLRLYWTGKTVGELTQRRNKKGTVELYVAHRSAQDNRSGRRAPDGTLAKVSSETAWTEIGRLMAEVREYAADRNMSNVPEIRVPTRESRSVEWLSRHQVARLLWAVRGRVWDEATGNWKVDEDGRRVLTRKRDIGWIARLILILVYTGSTANCAARLAWVASGDGTRSYVDLDEVMEGRIGHLYRLGPDLASKRMAGVPVAISRILTSHLGRWRALDGGRHERLLHLTGKRGSRQRSEGTINIGRATTDRVCERAGLAGLVNLPTLSDTAAVWALRAGSRKLNATMIDEYEPSPAIVRSVSFMIGVDTRSFAKRFDHTRLDFQEAAMKAAARLPPTVA